MSNIKYTTDGRKVAVIGNLNSQEKIVQEIFVSGDAEIPAGENFIVKSLLDAPAISWKEKQLKEIDERYDRLKKEGNDKFRRLKEIQQGQQELLQNQIAFNAKAIKQNDPTAFEIINNLITGKFTHVVAHLKYSGPQIKSWEEFIAPQKDCYGYFSEMRMISIYGRADGSLFTKRHQYSDGSGGGDEFEVFTSYQEALDRVFAFLDEKPVGENNLNSAKEYGYVYAPDRLKEYHNACRKTYEQNIANYQKTIDENLAKLNNLPI